MSAGEEGSRRRRAFPKSLRLNRRPEFLRVFEHGRSASDGRLVVYAYERPEGGPARLGLAVRRKFGSAPERNLWKRRTREAFRTGHDGMPPGHDLVVIPARDALLPSFAEIFESLRSVARRAARLLRDRGPR
jgi:ribonuclease P protein component